MAPEGRQRIRDLGGELHVGAGDILPKVEAGESLALFALLGEIPAIRLAAAALAELLQPATIL